MKKIRNHIVMLLVMCLVLGNINVIHLKAAEDSTYEMDEYEEDREEQIDEREYFDVTFNIESEWENHYNGLIKIRNISDADIENWKISFVTSNEIENIWCGEIVSHESDTYVVKNMGWNQDIKAGKEISFGFTASYDDKKDIPHGFYMSQECRKVEVSYSINYNIVSEWDTGLNGEITIRNNSEKVIEDWKLLLDCTTDINAFWTADIAHKENNTYYIGNRGYNSNIQPNETMVLGFNAKKDKPNDVFKMDNLQLYCMDVYQEDTTDTDKDGLYDIVEKSIGTDINNADSDGDGLDDYQEVEILGLDPLSKDSDGNGIVDFDEDNDGDGLSNGEEILLGCNPMLGDSDEDRLNDFEEVKLYNTNPNEEDTDGDSVSDFIEVELGLNPLLKDTDNDGVLDSDEKIQQNYHIDMNSGIAHSLDLSMASNLYLEDELDVECYTEADELTSLNLDGTMYKLDGDVTEENTPAKITFVLNNDTYNSDMKVYCYKDGKFVPIEFIYNVDNNCITADVEKLSEQYCLGYEKPISTFSRRANLKAAKKVKYSKQDLVNNIKNNFEKEKGWKAKVRKYKVSEAVDIVLKYDSEISKAAKKYKVKKEVIQAVLARELICIWAQDAVADSAVMNYYHNQREIEYYMSLKWWQQLFYGQPNCLYPQREDSSTGIGQMYAKTSINATNYLGETNIDYANWKKRKVVWFKLKDNNKYSAKMVAKVLCSNAKKKNMSDPTKKEIQNIAALYNASTVKKGAAYGKKIYKYNKWFAKYNKYN